MRIAGNPGIYDGDALSPNKLNVQALGLDLQNRMNP